MVFQIRLGNQLFTSYILFPYTSTLRNLVFAATLWLSNSNVFQLRLNRPVSFAKANLNLLADIIAGDDSCPPSTSARDARTKGKCKTSFETQNLGKNSGSSRV